MLIVIPIIAIHLQLNLSIFQGVSPLAASGKKGTYDCIRVLRKFSELTRQTFFKMFDVQIKPIALYGSKVWGLQRIDVIEKIHTFACNTVTHKPLKGGRGCLMSPPCPESQDCHLIPLRYLLSCSSA